MFKNINILMPTLYNSSNSECPISTPQNISKAKTNLQCIRRVIHVKVSVRSSRICPHLGTAYWTVETRHALSQFIPAWYYHRYCDSNLFQLAAEFHCPICIPMCLCTFVCARCLCTFVCAMKFSYRC